MIYICFVFDIVFYLMIGKILGFWLVNCHMIWSCINLSESCINLPVFVCMYACSFLLPMQRSRRQSWDKFVINCFGVWYNLYLAIRGLYHPRLRLGWYSPLIARYKLYHTPKQLITNSTLLVQSINIQYNTILVLLLGITCRVSYDFGYEMNGQNFTCIFACINTEYFILIWP